MKKAEMSETDFIIRTARLTDIDSLMQIENDSFVAGVREERELYLKRIEVFADGFLVAEDVATRRVVGYISSELWRDDQTIGADVLALGHNPADLHHADGQHLYITSFGVLSEFRGQKIGLKLFQTLEETVRQNFPNVVREILIVSERWLTARKIYARNGFKETGRIIDFFTPDALPAEDAVIMMKDL